MSRRQGLPWRLCLLQDPSNFSDRNFPQDEEAFTGSNLYSPHSDYLGRTLLTAGSAGTATASRARYAYGAERSSPGRLQADIPVPHTQRARALHQFFRLPSKNAEVVLCFNHEPDSAPLHEARPSERHSRPERICRTPRRRPAPPHPALSHTLKMALQVAKCDICHLADDICRHKSTQDAACDILSRTPAKKSCHGRKKASRKRGTLEDIG